MRLSFVLFKGWCCDSRKKVPGCLTPARRYYDRATGAAQVWGGGGVLPPSAIFTLLCSGCVQVKYLSGNNYFCENLQFSQLKF
jgi:hypothetical protein